MAARKQTSQRVSSLAARTLRKLDGVPGGELLRFYNEAALHWVNVKVADVKAICASAMGQDETPRKVAKRGKRG
jgi:hypothetical protein